MKNSIHTAENAIRFHSQGEGSAIVLLHGFPLDSGIWKKPAEILSRQFRVILPDLPGFGASSAVPVPESLDAVALQLQEMLKTENVDRCVMVGHSMGGYITLAFAEKFPGLLSGFGLLHATAAADSSEKQLARKKSLDAISRLGSLAWVNQMIPGLFSATFLKEYPETVQSLIGSAAGTGPGILAAYQKAMMERPDRTRVLGHAKVPVLFIGGMQDPLLSVRQVQIQADLARVGSFHSLQGAAHMGMLESGPELSAILSDFATFCFNHRFELNL
jgi:pimeloyl-ACP methyl ester carboxylesterase